MLETLTCAVHIMHNDRIKPACRTGDAIVLALLILMSAPASLAQDQASRQAKEPPSESGSRSMDIRVSSTIRLEHRAGGCKANLQMEYWQKGDVAEVESTLTNAECSASSGAYTIQVRYRGSDGELRTDAYRETWERADAAPVLVVKQYPIGDDVDLVRVRSQGLSCVCADGGVDADTGNTVPE